MSRYNRVFPKSCYNCPYQTVTDMCGKLFDLNKFLAGKKYKTANSKRRVDCPLTIKQTNDIKNAKQESECKSRKKSERVNIKIGQEVFLRPSGNLVRTSRGIKRGNITKMGRKYFYVNGEKFDITTLKNINEDCNSAWVLYFSEQEILDEDEKNLLYKKFRILFEWTSKETLTLTQLREMAKIAEIDYFT